jgi:hypothetical protein
VLYSDALRNKLEAAFKKGRSKVAIDTERFVDLSNWIQRRKDDPTRRRAVTRSVGPLAVLKRESSSAASVAPTTAAAAPPPAKKGKKSG